MTPQIEELEDLLDQLIIAAQSLMASGEGFPTALQNEITQEIAALNQEIETLYQQETGETIPGSVTPSVPDNVKLVWILAGGREDVFKDYLSNFPDPSFQQILANPSELERIVTDLHRNEPINNRGEQADGIPKSEINSSNVYGVQYDFKKKNLLVRFNNGAVYAYDAPPQLYNLVAGGRASATTDDKRKPMRWWRSKTPSLGAAVWQHLRNTGVPYRRLK